MSLQSDCKSIAQLLRTNAHYHSPEMIRAIATIAVKDQRGQDVEQEVHNFLLEIGKIDFRINEQGHYLEVAGDFSNDDFLLMSARQTLCVYCDLSHELFTDVDFTVFWKEMSLRGSKSPFTPEYKRRLDERMERRDKIFSPIKVPTKPFSECSDEELLTWFEKYKEVDRNVRNPDEPFEQPVSVDRSRLASLSRAQYRQERYDLESYCDKMKKAHLDYRANRMRFMVEMSEGLDLNSMTLDNSQFLSGMATQRRKANLGSEVHLKDGHDATLGQSYKIKSPVPLDCNPNSLQAWESRSQSSSSNSSSLASFFKSRFTNDEQILLDLATSTNSVIDRCDANYEIREAVYRIAKEYTSGNRRCFSFHTYGAASHRGVFFCIKSIKSIELCGDRRNVQNKHNYNQGETVQQPLFVIMWMYTNLSALDARQLENIYWLKSRYSADPDDPEDLSQIYSSEASVDLMHSLIKANREKLKPTFVEQEESGLPKGVKISVLTEVPIRAPQTRACAHCSKIPPSIKMCAKCDAVGYCNEKCQKSHWREHKKTCGKTTSQISDSTDGRILKEQSSTQLERNEVHESSIDLPSALELKSQGNEFFKQKQYTQAISKYKQASGCLLGCASGSEAAKQLSVICSNQAQCHLNLGQGPLAGLLAHVAVWYDESNYKAGIRWAKAFLMQGNFSRALEIARYVLKIRSKTGADTHEIRKLIYSIKAGQAKLSQSNAS